MSHPPLKYGTTVKTVPVPDPSTDWTEESLASRQWGVHGEIVGHHDAHGLTYEVEHPDETIGHYEPRELWDIREPGIHLDRLIHEHVMDECPCVYESVDNIEDHIKDDTQRFMIVAAGLHLFRCPRCGHMVRDDFHKKRVVKGIPTYSTHGGEALKVLEKSFQDGYAISVMRDLDGASITHVERWTMNSDTIRIWDISQVYESHKCPTVAHAICIAALSVCVLDDVEEICDPWEYDGIHGDIRSYEVPEKERDDPRN